jgi:hypothetical protein
MKKEEMAFDFKSQDIEYNGRNVAVHVYEHGNIAQRIIFESDVDIIGHQVIDHWIYEVNGKMYGFIVTERECDVIDIIADDILGKGINVVAFDWDLTASEKHTGGRLTLKQGESWPETFMKQETYLTPTFKKLVPALLTRGIHVAIVTHGDGIHNNEKIQGGESLIRGILIEAFDTNIVDRIAIYARNPTLHKEMSKGKLWHLEKVGAQFQANRANILLIDDDFSNVQSAILAGYKTIYVWPLYAMGLQRDVFLKLSKYIFDTKSTAMAALTPIADMRIVLHMGTEGLAMTISYSNGIIRNVKAPVGTPILLLAKNANIPDTALIQPQLTPAAKRAPNTWRNLL